MPSGIYIHKKGTGGKKGRSGVYIRTKSAWNKGIKYTKEQKKNILANSCIFKKGKSGNPETQFKKGSSGFTGIHSEKTKQKIRNSDYHKNLKGEKHWNWQGGLTDLNHQIRSSFIYKELRRRAMQRDDYTCRTCRIRGGDLEVNHIKSFALILQENNIKTLEQAINCAELWNLDNLETLCIDCHKKTDTFGRPKKIIKIYQNA